MNLAIRAKQLPMILHMATPVSDKEFAHFCQENENWPVEREPNGDLLLMSPAGRPTSKINLAIAAFLYLWAQQDGTGEATGPDSAYTLPDTSIRMPDAAWYSKLRLNSLTEKQQAGFSSMCPEFIIELRSQTDRLPPLKKKMLSWIQNGAELAWLIDPKTRTVTIYRPNESPEELIDPTSVQGTGPIRGFELILSRVWG